MLVCVNSVVLFRSFCVRVFAFGIWFKFLWFGGCLPVCTGWWFSLGLRSAWELFAECLGVF